MALEFFEVIHFTNFLLELIFQLGHVVFREYKVFACSDVDRSLFFGRAAGIAEVAADGLLHRFAAAEQPEHDEKRHHGRDEISIGDLPRATVMATMAAFFLDDDDGTGFIHKALALLLSIRRLLQLRLPGQQLLHLYCGRQLPIL